MKSNKSRLQSILRFSILSVLLIMVYVSIVFIFRPDVIELKDIFTTGITLIGSMTIALIGRYGIREAVLSSKAESKDVIDTITKGLEEK